MASSIAFSNSATITSFHKNPISQNLILSPLFISFPFYNPLSVSIKTRPGGGRAIRSSEETAAPLLKKPVAPLSAGSDDEEGGGKWVDWEDQILADTVPLVGYVRMILHSGKYESGDRLSLEHERAILERLLPYHPECEKKIGCGVDYITIGYHPNFESSRCLFIVRKDGELVDFSYWKCIKGMIRKNYPLYADNFILRHFKKRRRYD